MIQQSPLYTFTKKKINRRQFLFAFGISLAALSDVVASIIHNIRPSQPEAKTGFGFGSKTFGAGTYGR